MSGPRRVESPEGTKVDALVARVASRQWGVVSVAELRACGLSPKAILVRVQAGRLHRIHRGVYAVGHPALTLEGRFIAAVKACGPDAVLSHFSAAALWRILEPLDRHPDVTAPKPRRHTGINTHRTRYLHGAAVVHRGIRTTTPKRTLEDLARTRITDKTLTRATREAQTLKLITAGDLEHHRLRAIAPAPTRSVLEDVVLELILRAGFKPPDVNVPLRIEGRTIIPDFRWPAQRLIVEADGAAYHGHTRRSDDERQALLEAHGERVIRVTHHQAVRRPEETVARIRAAGAPVD